MRSAVSTLRAFGSLLQKAGPYLLIEILLPGGTLLALLLFLYRRGSLEPSRLAALVTRAVGSIGTPFVLASRSAGVVAVVWRRPGGARNGLEVIAMAPAI